MTPNRSATKLNDKHEGGNDRVVAVNNRQITVAEREVTGLEIKKAAIASGLPIDEGFVLLLDEDDGRDRVIGDDEVIKVNKKSSFTAIAPDDNS